VGILDALRSIRQRQRDVYDQEMEGQRRAAAAWAASVGDENVLASGSAFFGNEQSSAVYVTPTRLVFGDGAFQNVAYRDVAEVAVRYERTAYLALVMRDGTTRDIELMLRHPTIGTPAYTNKNLEMVGAVAFRMTQHGARPTH
jgi:hypothetical protein